MSVNAESTGEQALTTANDPVVSQDASANLTDRSPFPTSDDDPTRRRNVPITVSKALQDQRARKEKERKYAADRMQVTTENQEKKQELIDEGISVRDFGA